jgi:hypothetical protein
MMSDNMAAKSCVRAARGLRRVSRSKQKISTLCGMARIDGGSERNYNPFPSFGNNFNCQPSTYRYRDTGK